MRKWTLGAFALFASIGIAILLQDGGDDSAHAPQQILRRDAPGANSLEDAPSVSATSLQGLGSPDRIEFSGRVVADAMKDLEIEIVHGDGAPGRGAKAAIFRGAELLHEGTADEAGRVRFPRVEAGARLAVGGICVEPWVGEIDATKSSHRIVLNRGSMLSGTVFVEESAPRLPVSLSIRCSHSEESQCTQGLPKAVLDAIEFVSAHEDIVQETGLGGRFAFSQLPNNWSGRLEFPDHFGINLEGEEAFHHSLFLDRPKENLLLKLFYVPAVMGRVVAADTKEPLPEAEIQYEMLTPRSARSNTAFSDREGNFRIPFLYQGMGQTSVAVDMDIFSADRKQSRRMQLREIDGESNHNLGDVELLASRDLSFLARDPQGKPISGAEAGWDARGDSDGWSEATDAQGLGRVLGIPRHVQKFWVAALGFHIEEVAIPADLRDPVPVVLRPSNILEIWVLDADGLALPMKDVWQSTVKVHIQSKESLFLASPAIAEAAEAQASAFGMGPPHYPDARLFPFGVTFPRGGSFSKDESHLNFHLNKEGKLLLANLRAGVPFTVSVLDDLDSVLSEEKVVVGPDDAHRVVRFRISGRPRSFFGSVVDAQGRPIGDVTISMAGSHEIRAVTNEQGRFSISNAIADRAAFWLKAPAGFVSIKKVLVDIPADGGLVEFVLQRGNSCSAIIQDEEGRVAEGVMVSARVGETKVEGDWDEESRRYLFDPLPMGECEITARVGGRIFTTKRSVGEEPFKLVIPSFGSLTVVMGSAPNEGDSYGVRVDALDGSKDSDFGWIAGDPGKSHSFPVLFPGRYQVRLQDWSGDQPVPIAYGEVEIEAGKTSSIQLSAKK